MENIDVSRDILNLDFLLKSDTNPKKMEYSLEVKEWTTDKINIQINFTDPLQVSQGFDRDTVYFNLKNP